VNYQLINILLQVLYIFVCFTLGTTAGSFLGVLVERIPAEKTWTKGRSHCDTCNHTLGFFDLIPVWSYLFLRGKCRYCHAKIPAKDFWSEVGMGLLFVALGEYFGWTMVFAEFAVMSTIAVPVGLIDLKSGLVPDDLVIPGAVFGLLFNAFFHGPYFQGHGWPLGNVLVSLEGIALGFGTIAFLILLSDGGMGWGDATLAGMLGAFVGVQGIAEVLFLAFIMGGFYGAYVLIRKKKERKDTIPFGPFLVIASYIVIFAGNHPVMWYFTNIHQFLKF
jgi:leader peptidase (prepilin peptidase)/N-methyltransferase